MDDAQRPPDARALSREAYLGDRGGAPMEERQCKILCLNCGMARDCRDP